MIIGKTLLSISQKEILQQYPETKILKVVFPEITTLPCRICSPFRVDKHPSFNFYLNSKGKVCFKDFGDSQMQGSLTDFLQKYWNCSFSQVLNKIHNLMEKQEIPDTDIKISESRYSELGKVNRIVDVQVTVRPWRNYDYEYWNTYGITPEWLRYAEVYPISHKIVTKQSPFKEKPDVHTFNADKYAYCFVERKDEKVSLKIYQPFNKKGFKWCSKMDASVWSLWTKIPKTGDNLIISSSLKDCLNISCQLHIPAICMQGEGYMPKPKIIDELKGRFKKIIVFFDNDYSSAINTGHEDSKHLAEKYSLARVEIPEIYGAKDPSDLYKKHGQKKYLEVMHSILDPVLYKQQKEDELPF